MKNRFPIRQGFYTGVFMLLFALSACQPYTAQAETTTPMISNSISTPIEATQIADLQSTPTGFSTLIASTPNPAWKTVQESNDWFSLSVPADWQADGEQRFSGADGFVEMGFLPDMGYMKNALQVCQWMANVDTQNVYSVNLLDINSSCKLTPLDGQSDFPLMIIIENPDAPSANRYAYLKTDVDHASLIMGSFNWLSTPTSVPDDMDALKETDFWSNAVYPDDITVSEIELPPVGEDFQDILSSLVPIEALPTAQNNTTTLQNPQTWEAFNQSVAKYGYEFRATDRPNWYQFYQNGELKIDNVYSLPTLHHIVTENGEKIVFLVIGLKDVNLSPYEPGNATQYIVDEHNIEVWETGLQNLMQLVEYMIAVNGDILWARMGNGTRIEVINANHEVLYAFGTYFGSRIPMEGFWSWKNHWVLEISDFIIIDGQVLNREYGYEAMFGWHLVNDEPFYFFQDGPNYGVSYHGQILPLHYDEIKHGKCCGYAIDNPRISQDSARFFAEKEGKWFYVTIKFEAK